MTHPSIRLEPFFVHDEKLVTDFLVTAFPEQGRNVWQSGFQRMRTALDEAQPMGTLLRSETDEVAGVLLTIPRRKNVERPECARVVNLSSWYIAPDYRSRAIWMLGEVTGDENTTFIDLSPTPIVSKLSRKMGFRPIADDMLRINLLTAAFFGKTSCNVLNAEATIERVDDKQLKKELAVHQEWGLTVCGLEADGVVSPLVFETTTKRGIVPGLSLIYAADHSQVFRHLRSLARYLLRRGRMFIELDCLESVTPPPGAKRLGYNSRLCKGDYPERGTDYLFSESIIFPFVDDPN